VLAQIIGFDNLEDMKRDKNILLSKKKGKVLKMETRKSLFSDKQKLIPKFNDDSFKKKNKTDNF